MQSKETPPTGNTEAGSTSTGNNPWIKMAREAGPFQAGASETHNGSGSSFNRIALRDTLINAVAQSEQQLHDTPTEDAEIDLAQARQDADTFDMLMGDYMDTHGRNIPPLIQKSDFVTTINQFMDDHSAKLNQLLTESRTLIKGTAAYAKNKSERKQLARERSSAKRLHDRYFGTEPDDEGQDMEKRDLVKTPEQIAHEQARAQRERAAAEARRQAAINEQRERVLRTARQQEAKLADENTEEQEEEMSM